MSGLDPRTKLALGLMGLVAVLLSRSPWTLLVEAAVLVSAIGVLRFTGRWVLSLRLSLPMAAMVFVIGLISFDTGTAATLALRLLNLLTVTFIFFQTMPAEELADAMTRLALPRSFSFILTTSMHYVPLMGRRIRAVMDAQRSRGIDLRPKLKNLPNYLALLMPLLVQAFMLSEGLAMAMEARGFSRPGRSIRRRYRIRVREIILMACGLALLSLFLGWGRR